MNGTFRNFWLDIFLFLLLGADIALVGLPHRTSAAGIQPGSDWHLHAVISILLTLGCLLHILLHWRWFLAVLTGKAKGRMKLIMNSMVAIMLLLAGLSGPTAHLSAAAGNFHDVTGILALLGMSVHGIKHIGWMILTARRLTGGQHHLEQMSSSD